jgi:hypothetical protein
MCEKWGLGLGTQVTAGRNLGICMRQIKFPIVFPYLLEKCEKCGLKKVIKAVGKEKIPKIQRFILHD